MTNKQGFRIKKVIKRKCDKLIANRKIMIIRLIVGSVQKISLYKNEFFPGPTTNKSEIEIELDLSNYATKSDLKSATGVDTC